MKHAFRREERGGAIFGQMYSGADTGFQKGGGGGGGPGNCHAYARENAAF